MERKTPKSHGAFTLAGMILKPWLSRDEAAEYLGVSSSFVDRKLRSVLPIYLLGPGSRVYVYSREEIDAWVRSFRVDLTDLVA